MQPILTKVRYLDEYRLELSFSDGQKRTMDFRDEVLSRSGVWTPLHDRNFFRQAFVDAEFGALTWPNGVDYCPDVLYSLATGVPIERRPKQVSKTA